MAIMEDKGAFSAQCPKGKRDQTSCLIKNLIEDMDYINSHYANQPWYMREGSDPIVLFFLHEPGLVRLGLEQSLVRGEIPYRFL
jgi:hypothetical protein